jgi:F0F1-type ATP synthase membrane subunit b/b'
VENEERPDEREQEIKHDLDELEQQGDQMDERADELEKEVGDAREDFERKQHSPEAPGAQPDD